MAYLRFEAPGRLLPGPHDYGIFGLAYDMKRDPEVPDYYRILLREKISWFETHMPVPRRFSRRHNAHKVGVGICWLKPEAREMIAEVRDLSFLLSEIGRPVFAITAEDPGFILYEDHCQIVAEAFKRWRVR